MSKIKKTRDVIEKPAMHYVTIQHTNGEEKIVKMCMPEGTVRRLTTDCFSHHAWQGASAKSYATRVQQFNKKYGFAKNKNQQN